MKTQRRRTKGGTGKGILWGLGISAVLGVIARVVENLLPAARGTGSDKVTAYFAGWSDGRDSLQGKRFEAGDHLRPELQAHYNRGFQDAVALKPPVSPEYTREEWQRIVDQDGRLP